MTNIYLITNKLNGKKYVGKTVKSINTRFLQHCNAPTHTYIDNALKKYGRKNFSVELLMQCKDDEWKYWETYYIKFLHTHISEGGYNLSMGGDHNPMEDEEVRHRHALVCKSDAFRNKQRLKSLGRYHTEESRKKMSIVQKQVYSDLELRRRVKLHQPTIIPIGMLDEQGNIIKVFESLADVCRYFNKDAGNISALHKYADKINKNGKRAKFWGYSWTIKNVKV